MKKYFIILIFIVFSSCKDVVLQESGLNFYFENPQPINNSELKEIPVYFRGEYINKDSTFLKIEKNIITTFYNFKFKVHSKFLDSLKNDFEILNGRLIGKKTNEIYFLKQTGDSLELINKKVDTLFIISQYQKAKRFDGNLILNTKDSSFWKVKWISLKGNNLKINYILDLNDLVSVDSITKVKSKMLDSTSFIISPSRKEFKKIKSLKDFGHNSEFQKI